MNGVGHYLPGTSLPLVRAVLRLPGAEFRYRLIPAYHLDFRRLFLTTAQRAFLDVDLFNYGLHSGETSLSLCIFSRYAILCYPHSTTGSAINQPTWRQELNGHKIPLAPAHLRTWTQGWDLQSPRSPGKTGFTWTSRFLVNSKNCCNLSKIEIATLPFSWEEGWPNGAACSADPSDLPQKSATCRKRSLG